MLKIVERPLALSALGTLEELQQIVDSAASYAGRVVAAKQAWDQKMSTAAKAAAFRTIRHTLERMCVGPVRCAYCEDSLADEIEHIRPKNLFPEITFSWPNYLFACGPCNGPKSNRYGYLAGEHVIEFARKKHDTVEPPPAGPSALVDPRAEDPLVFLELDMGGVAPDGMVLVGTFDLLPADGLSVSDERRARFSIDVLGLNREVIRAARQNAFGGYRSRLREYVEEKEVGADLKRLAHLRNDLLATPHLTVFAEMRRQRRLLPEIDNWFNRAPEALDWPLVATTP